MTAQIKREHSRYMHWVMIVVAFLLLACLLANTTMASRRESLMGPRHAVVGGGALASLNWGSPCA
jgi:hypothetical protein